MRIFLDTNILIDYLTERQPFFKYALQIIEACESGELEGCIYLHSQYRIFFIFYANI